MKARDLIEGATYGPETLKVICKAFDDAWSEIAGHFTHNGLQVPVSAIETRRCRAGCCPRRQPRLRRTQERCASDHGHELPRTVGPGGACFDLITAAQGHLRPRPVVVSLSCASSKLRQRSLFSSFQVAHFDLTQDRHSPLT